MKKEPLTGMALLLATFSLSLGTFMQILDTSITNVAIPTIAGDLAVSPDDGSWVITSFMISNAVVLPLTGWFALRFGSVRLFCWSAILFSITSFLCGMATSLGMLVFFRILQGATSGALIPLSQGLLLQVYPPERKGEALGVWVMIVAASPFIGPVLGGWIAFNYNWQWIFYINVPVGFLSAFLTYAVIKDYESETKKMPLDLLGIILLILAVGSMQVMLDKGNDWDWFQSPAIRALAVTSVLCYLYFLVWELMQEKPLIDFSFFRDHNFLYATIAMSLAYFVFFGVLVSQPLWLQEDMGYTPFLAGYALTPMGIFPVIFSKTVGKYMGRTSLRLLVTLSFLIFAYSFFASSNFTTDVMISQIMWQRFLQGISITLWFAPLTALSIVSIPPEKVASASGIFTFLRMVAGGGVGTSLFVTMLSRRGIFHHARIAETATTYSPWTAGYYADLAQYNIVGKPATAFFNDMVNQQAAMLAMNDLFWVSGWLLLFCVPLVWLCKEPPRMKKKIAL